MDCMLHMEHESNTGVENILGFFWHEQLLPFPEKSAKANLKAKEQKFSSKHVKTGQMGQAVGNTS